jgi:hypothetical protein
MGTMPTDRMAPPQTGQLRELQLAFIQQIISIVHAKTGESSGHRKKFGISA